MNNKSPTKDNKRAGLPPSGIPSRENNKKNGRIPKPRCPRRNPSRKRRITQITNGPDPPRGQRIRQDRNNGIHTYRSHRPRYRDLGEGGRNLHLLELPPQPIVQSDGHIQEGISYRYQGHLIVRPFDPDKYIDGKLSRKDFASVQLQLVECLNLLGRKNDDQGFQTKEMEGMNRKLREVIMVEDQLYRDFATRYATWVDEIKQVKDREADTAEKLRAEQIKTKDMDRIVQYI